MPDVRMFATEEGEERLLKEVRRLLHVAFEGDFTEDDWKHTIGGWHAVVVDGAFPVAHAAVVPRTLHVADRSLLAGYVEGVATTPQRRHEGLGSLVMSEIMGLIRVRFELGGLSTNRQAFYDRLGWERWRGPTYVRLGSQLVRTDDEDDGVMVLRFGKSLECDITAPIACEPRSGDDW